ncbi:unnamed protein product [Adineta ricciae]|uniref:Uncharacterized protein n=1 Tax=Adineta ricciae TaxID=249248 RepID=A0A813TM76_ADIRI|nr:unnamed protein product [Adineta ricciae]CAF0869838.1 unnamed protein product [Adineta ricciae]
MNTLLPVTILYVLVFQCFDFIKVEATEICFYRLPNSTRVAVSCSDACCTTMGVSSDTTCCSTISWGSIAIPFFVFTGVCVLAICILYCRPLWKTCFCGHKCPCSHRSRVTTPTPSPTYVNPVYIVNNDDLPDYDTIIKDTSIKDGIPPPYTFVTTHPGDFGIEPRAPSAPPQYHSRRSSLSTSHPTAPVEP